MSRSSKRESGLTFSGSSPNSTSAEITLSVSWSFVAVVMRLLLSLVDLGGHAAVDWQHGPGHVRGLVRGQEADARGDLVGRTGSPRWNVVEQGAAGALPIGAGGEVARQLGLDQARGDRVHGDPTPCHLGGDSPREA